MVVDNWPDTGPGARVRQSADVVRWAHQEKLTMSPEPMDKLDVAAMAAMNGPADDLPLTERIGG